jgi:hypothetical protein
LIFSALTGSLAAYAILTLKVPAGGMTEARFTVSSFWGDVPSKWRLVQVVPLVPLSDLRVRRVLRTL